ncbi:hypothetical protein [Micromonospora vulcania]|uniref:Integral membrane protein n=1 Tax=Micromonospora vulcania TaxID=1441873 RepID=A0ABW1H9E8_9ACTN
MWLGPSKDDGQPVLGPAVSLTVLVLSLVLTAIAAVLSVVIWYGTREWSRGRRWAVAGPLVVVAVGVAVLGVGSLFPARWAGDVMLGCLLLIAAAAMAAVSAQVVRVRPSAARDRLRKRFEELRKDRPR